jgi:hypothetical protein
MAFWVVFRAVNFVRTMGAVKALVVDPQKQPATDPPVAVANPSCRLNEQAELLMHRHVSELTLAEHLLRRPNFDERLVNDLYQRTLVYLLVGLALAFWLGLLGSLLWAIFFSGMMIHGFDRARETRAAISALMLDDSAPSI